MNSIQRQRSIWAALPIVGMLLACTAAAHAADELIQDLNAADSVEDSTSTVKTIRDRTTNSNDVIFRLKTLPPKPRVAASRSENVFHGKIRLREVYRQTNDGRTDTRSRVESNGSLERIQAGPYSLAWNGDLSYRNGNAYSSATDYQDPKLHLYQAALSRRDDDGGSEHFGRFVPMAIPGIGFMDGALIERHTAQPIRLGAGFGARPQRQDLKFSSRELVAAVYGTGEAGKRGAGYYSGTIGFFQTLYRGSQDEMAMLFDQQADLGRHLQSYFSSQVDLNTGSARAHTEKARLTRMNFNVQSPISSFLTLRTGANHFERPDTAAERDLSGIDNLSVFDNGTWRSWVGASEFLPWNFQLDQEAAVVRVPSRPDQGQVRGSLTRRGLFGNPLASISLTAYNLIWFEGEGIGGNLSSIIPLMDNRLNFNANLGSRYRGISGEPKRLKLSDGSLFLDWFVTRHWTASLGLLQTSEDHIESTVADASLSYRW